MPVSTELFLAMTNPAPAGSSGKSASINNSGPQGAAQETKDNSAQNPSDTFTSYLAQDAEKPKGSPPTATQTTGNPELLIEVENTDPKNGINVDRAYGKTQEPSDPLSNDVLNSKDTRDSNSTDSVQLALKTSQPDEVPEPLKGVETDKNIASLALAPAEIQNPEVDIPEGQDPKENKTFDPTPAEKNSQGENGKQAPSSEGKTSEGENKPQPVLPSVTSEKNQVTPDETDQKGTESKVSTPAQVTTAQVTTASAQEDLLAKPLEGQARLEDEGATAAPKTSGEHKTQEPLSNTQEPHGSTDQEKIAAQTSTLPQDETPELEAMRASDQKEAGLTATASVSPEKQIGQQTVASQQLAPTIKPESLRDKRDVEKVLSKGNGEKASNVSADRKEQFASIANAKGSSQNSAGEQNSTKGTQAETAKAKSSAVNTPSLTGSKIPFLTELSQTLTSGDSKPIQLTTSQLQTGLLSLQEVGQNSSQSNNLANNLAPTGLVRQTLSQFNPRMVTNQISLAITKQGGGDQQTFKISLNPAELGQVDIKMNFQADGRMTATVTVENERTLNLLQKDQGALEKALENAGFEAGGNNLNFSLKKHQQEQTQPQFAGDNNEEADGDELSQVPNSIFSQQQLKMTYSDNALDINI